MIFVTSTQDAEVAEKRAAQRDFLRDASLELYGQALEVHVESATTSDAQQQALAQAFSDRLFAESTVFDAHKSLLDLNV